MTWLSAKPRGEWSASAMCSRRSVSVSRASRTRSSGWSVAAGHGVSSYCLGGCRFFAVVGGRPGLDPDVVGRGPILAIPKVPCNPCNLLGATSWGSLYLRDARARRCSMTASMAQWSQRRHSLVGVSRQSHRPDSEQGHVSWQAEHRPGSGWWRRPHSEHLPAVAITLLATSSRALQTSDEEDWPAGAPTGACRSLAAPSSTSRRRSPSHAWWDARRRGATYPLDRLAAEIRVVDFRQDCRRTGRSRPSAPLSQRQPPPMASRTPCTREPCRAGVSPRSAQSGLVVTPPS